MPRRRYPKRISSSPPISDLQFKLSLVVSRHQHLKTAFDQLHSQIRAGLLEAEDVFASLAMPLMKLVGMKTVEMAVEGRVSEIINIDAISNAEDRGRNEIGSGIATESSTSGVRADQNQTDATFKEESFANKVNIAGKELVQKQRLQLLQLVHTLKQIKSEISLSQDDILQTLANRKQSIHKFLQQAVKHIQVIYQSGEDNVSFLFILKVLKAIFNNVGITLCSVEDGVEELINNLAEKMYNPMVQYVHGLKEEMSTGTCPRLLSVVAEMEKEMRIGRLQLEESEGKVKELEKSRLHILHLLKGSEGLVKTKGHAGNVLEDGRSSYRQSRQQKLLDIPTDGKADDKLLWEMLRNKRKYQLSSSPQGPSNLLGIGSSNKQLKSTKLTARRNLAHRPDQSMVARIPLGSSPSATAQQVSFCQSIIQ
ncbi:hypothetical protein Leryth_023886 [Lithospermum erythrorhizon]|nr:hypothetical protein Leryth_023886 [Lithospermum erythrorhizon]